MNRIVALVLSILILSGCGLPASLPFSSTPTYTPTAIPPTPTLEPTSTATAIPTDTLTPTATVIPSVTPTPLPQPITSDNIHNLRLTRQLGNGTLKTIVWAADSSMFIILTTQQLIALNAQGDQLWSELIDGVQYSAAIAADQSKIITISADGAVEYRDISTGKVTGSGQSAQRNIEFLSLSPDGGMMGAHVYEQGLFTWDAANDQSFMQAVNPSLNNGVWDLHVSPDHQKMLVCGFNASDYFQMQLWNPETGGYLGGLTRIPMYMDHLGFSTDGKYIVATGKNTKSQDNNSFLYVWYSANGAFLKELDARKTILRYAYQPVPTSFILGLGDGSIVQYGLPTLAKTAEYPRQKSAVKGMAVSPDGKLLVTFTVDGAMSIWDTATRKEMHSTNIANDYYHEPDYRAQFAFYAPRSILARVWPGWGGIDLINALTGKDIRSFGDTGDNGYYAPAFSRDGKYLAAVENSRKVVIWDVATGVQVKLINTIHNKNIRQLGFSLDGSTIFSMAVGEMYGWEIKSGSQTYTYSGFSSFDFSPDGLTIVSDNVDFGMYVWDLMTRKLGKLVTAEYINNLAFSPDGTKIAVAGYEVQGDIHGHNGLVYLVDAKTYEPLPLQLFDFNNETSKVTFSPDGKLLATGDIHGNVAVWDLESGKKLASFDNIVEGIPSIYFTANGESIILGGMDGTIRILESRPGTFGISGY